MATLAAAASAGAATFSNTTPLSEAASSGPLGPYPSVISVSGVPGTVTNARVTLVDLSGGPVPDFDVLLVGPSGSSLLVSDACSAGGTVPDFLHSELTFDDEATAPIPETCAPGSPTGAFKPTNYDTSDAFPGVAGPYPVSLGTFRARTPNGAWLLYAFDDQVPDAFTVAGGWRLELTTTGAPETATKKKCKRKKHHHATVAKKKRCKKKKRRRG